MMACQNWKLYFYQNEWLKVVVAPEIGGRVLQLEMDGFPYFFIHPDLYDIEIPESRLGPNKSWLNFGGEKIWPAPQGWDNYRQWPGPPDPILDGGAYHVLDSQKYNMELLSPIDPYTGLQIRKKVLIDEMTTKVTIDCTFTNKSKDIKEWSIWPVLQLNTGEDDENRYRVYCPINPTSKFQNGIKIMHGLVNSPQIYINQSHQLELRYKYLVGKIGMDTSEGWSAYVDYFSGKTLVVFFDTLKNARYPEDTNIQFYTAGEGLIYSRSLIRRHLKDKKLNPPYLEMELLSPLEKLHPGESMHFCYQLATTTIAVNHPIYAITSDFVIVDSLKLECKGNTYTFTGKYGVYIAATMELRQQFSDKSNKCVWSNSVSPLHPVNIEYSMLEDAFRDTDFFELVMTNEYKKSIVKIERIIPHHDKSISKEPK